jgi:hypothetical protein
MQLASADMAPGGAGAPPMSPFPPAAKPLTSSDKLNLAFKGAIDAVALDPAFVQLPDLRTIPLAIVALQDDPHPLAGQGKFEMHYSGSLLKVAAMYAAYQLRAAVNDLAATLAVATPQDLFSKVKSIFDPQIRNAVARINNDRQRIGDELRLPKYEQIFNATKNGDHFTLDFKAAPTEFFHKLNNMIVESDNDAAGYCIRNLGYSWINGVLQHAGFFDPEALGQEGIWLAGDYNEWLTVDIPSKNDGMVKQATTCYDMAKFMATLHDQKLVRDEQPDHPDSGNLEMLDLLHLAVDSRPPDGPHARSLLKRPFEPPPLGHAPPGSMPPFTILHTKIGVGNLKRDPNPPHSPGSCNDPIHGCVFSEASILQHSPGHRFVAVWQNVVDAREDANGDLMRIVKVIQKTMDNYLT